MRSFVQRLEHVEIQGSLQDQNNKLIFRKCWLLIKSIFQEFIEINLCRDQVETIKDGNQNHADSFTTNV